MPLGAEAQHPGVVSGCTDIIDNVGPGVQGGPGRGGVARVDADRHLYALGPQRADHRQDPGLLLLRGHGRSTGSRAFSADVEDVCAIGDQLQAMLKRGLNRIMAAAVRKAVGRYIDDAHDQGQCQAGHGRRNSKQIQGRCHDECPLAKPSGIIPTRATRRPPPDQYRLYSTQARPFPAAPRGARTPRGPARPSRWLVPQVACASWPPARACVLLRRACACRRCSCLP